MSFLSFQRTLLILLLSWLFPWSVHAERVSMEGSWAFSLPDENPVWLSVEPGDDDSQPKVKFLWSVGSARPLPKVEWEANGFRFTRKNLRWKPFGGKATRYVIGSLRVEQVSRESALLSFEMTEAVVGPKPDQPRLETITLKGVKIPPLPSRPDLDHALFGEPIELFNGRNLEGWKLARENQLNGWRAEGGVLVNETPKTDFSGYGIYGNLVTEKEFADFKLTLEYNVPAGGNSGVYLRGMYEAQVVDRDSRMQGISGPGAIFGRLQPRRNAGNPGGQWNRYELTLVHRHITVVLNGETVIDNQPLPGCTGGGMRSNDGLPGPILLQGDHTSVRYRNLKLQPLLGFDSETDATRPKL